MSTEEWDGVSERRRPERERQSLLEDIRAELVNTRVELSRAVVREARSRRRALTAASLPLLISALSGVASLAVLWKVSDSSDINKATLNRLEDCTLVGGECYQELVRSGQQGTVRLMRYFRCVLGTPIEDRSGVLFERCEIEALGDVLGGGGEQRSDR